jgi:DNA-binding LytR/AlgR family response regulator
MNILIVEDEQPSSDKLKRLLTIIDPKMVVSDVVETVEACTNRLQFQPLPDLILMDVQLADGVCFEIFDFIKVNTPIIFTTAYDEYVMKAFKVNGIDYLLKPIDKDKLAAAIDKCTTLFPLPQLYNNKMTQVAGVLAKEYKSRFLVKVGEQYRSLLTSDIESLCVQGEYTCLRTFAGKRYNVDYSLQQLDTMLSPDYFFRINRTCIVRIDAITNILGFSGKRLKLVLKNSNQEDLIVSREKVASFKKWLDK